MARDNSRPTILVVGAGLAGLFCALECVRNSFHVILLESRTSVQSAGDFITIGPTAIHAFSRWPKLAKAFDDATYKPDIWYHKQDGECVAGPMPPHPNYGSLVSRPALHKVLLEALEAENVPIRCNAKVTRYFESDMGGGVELLGGEIVEGDIVVAADGIHSKSWMVISDEEPQTKPSGLAIFRAAFPIENAKASQFLRERWIPATGKETMGFFLGPSSFGIVLFGTETASWVWQHTENPDTSSESWAATLSPEEALKQIDTEGDWSPDLRAMIAATPPKHIVDWRLILRDLRRKWSSHGGRIIQIGDAAHPFLPTSVNGGTQALEDATSLAVCLRLAVTKYGAGSLTDGVKVHNALRIDRVAAIQQTAKIRLEKYKQLDFEEVKKNPELIRNQPAQWQIDHDPQSYAEERFEDCLCSLRKGTTFVNMNKPAEYTFTPGDKAI